MSHSDGLMTEEQLSKLVYDFDLGERPGSNSVSTVPQGGVSDRDINAGRLRSLLDSKALGSDSLGTGSNGNSAQDGEGSGDHATEGPAGLSLATEGVGIEPLPKRQRRNAMSFHPSMATGPPREDGRSANSAKSARSAEKQNVTAPPTTPEEVSEDGSLGAGSLTESEWLRFVAGGFNGFTFVVPSDGDEEAPKWPGESNHDASTWPKRQMFPKEQE